MRLRTTQIIDVYIYGDYALLNKAGRFVPQKRTGSRIAEIQGQPNVSKIIENVLETGKGRIIVCGKYLVELLVVYN